MTFTLNHGANTAVKSDSLVDDELRRGLKAAFDKLRANQADEPDWHPWTDDKVQDLVHPSMYPFVYGACTPREYYILNPSMLRTDLCT